MNYSEFQDTKKEDLFVINTIEEVFEDAGDVSDEEKFILKRQFRAADFDNNKLLSESEMTMAISRETKQHILVISQILINVFAQYALFLARNAE